MHPEVIAGLALALACAIGANLGGLWKQKGAVATDDVDIRRPLKSAVALFRSKWWLIGWIVAGAAWALHVGALSLAPISLAQAVISGGLVFLGVIAERWFGFSLGRRQWTALALVSIGMAFLAGTSGSASSNSHFATAAMAAFEAGALLAGAACVLACRVNRLSGQQGLLLGAAAGLLFGLADVSIKAVTGSSGGSSGVLSPWTLAALVAGIAAFFASARSLQVGDGVAVIATTAAVANVIGIVAGVIVFGDPIGSSPLLIAGKAVAFVLVIVAVAFIPAPVRAQEKIASEEEESRESDGRREAAASGEPALEPARAA